MPRASCNCSPIMAVRRSLALELELARESPRVDGVRRCVEARSLKGLILSAIGNKEQALEEAKLGLRKDLSSYVCT